MSMPITGARADLAATFALAHSRSARQAGERRAVDEPEADAAREALEPQPIDRRDTFTRARDGEDPADRLSAHLRRVAGAAGAPAPQGPVVSAPVELSSPLGSGRVPGAGTERP
jgi:hypothetical protein